VFSRLNVSRIRQHPRGCRVCGAGCAARLDAGAAVGVGAAAAVARQNPKPVVMGLRLQGDGRMQWWDDDDYDDGDDDGRHTLCHRGWHAIALQNFELKCVAFDSSIEM
jgi:hypothetical protein